MLLDEFSENLLVVCTIFKELPYHNNEVVDRTNSISRSVKICPYKSNTITPVFKSSPVSTRDMVGEVTAKRTEIPVITTQRSNQPISPFPV